MALFRKNTIKKDNFKNMIKISQYLGSTSNHTKCLEYVKKYMICHYSTMDLFNHDVQSAKTLFDNLIEQYFTSAKNINAGGMISTKMNMDKEILHYMINVYHAILSNTLTRLNRYTSMDKSAFLKICRDAIAIMNTPKTTQQTQPDKK
jgi:hypothetical protein